MKEREYKITNAQYRLEQAIKTLPVTESLDRIELEMLAFGIRQPTGHRPAEWHEFIRFCDAAEVAPCATVAYEFDYRDGLFVPSARDSGIRVSPELPAEIRTSIRQMQTEKRTPQIVTLDVQVDSQHPLEALRDELYGSLVDDGFRPEDAGFWYNKPNEGLTYFRGELELRISDFESRVDPEGQRELHHWFTTLLR